MSLERRNLTPLTDNAVPTELTTWDWLFDSPHSPLAKVPESQLAGYQNAVTKERINWKQVKDYSTYLSTALVKKYGMKEGQTVSLFSQNTIWYPVALHGAIRAGEIVQEADWIVFTDSRIGGKVSGASPAYNVEEMTYALKTADAKFIFTAPGSIEVGVAAAEQAGIPKSNVFMLEGNVSGYTTIQDLIQLGKSYGESGQVKAYKIPPGKKNKDVCGFLSFSSGTTGLPKAVSAP